MNQNERQATSIMLIVFGFVLISLVPLIGIVFLIIGFKGLSDSAKQNNKTSSVGAGHKHTDFSGMNKNMVTQPRNHVHCYDSNQADYCGSSVQIQRSAAAKPSIPVNATARVRNNSYSSNVYFDGKTKEQIYREMISRKTDYSGVDPNILKRG